MGRHRAARGRGKKHDRDNQGWGQRGSYVMVVKENKAFEDYYKAQKVVPEGEWDAFMEKLREPLPATFRITGNRSQAKEVLRKIEGDYFAKLVDVEMGDKKLDVPQCLPWYPDKLAWQLNMSRKFIRQNDTLKDLHNFLISETESGNINRQEAVSMIPPLVLDIQPEHKVLDMCAAPGSKTAQLIEYLHADGPHIPEGFVVANDSDNKRCYLMVHQVKRLESPCFLIVNHDATLMPSLRSNPLDEKKKEVVKFDRILADVPCSGDGTMRKNPDVWGKWNAAAGNNLHHLQQRILRRGLEMLAVGGRLVYSTCSFNPVEDEAVLSYILQTCRGSVELVDVADKLPGLKATPGISTWKVYSRGGDMYETFADVPERLTTQIRPSMFPPPVERAESLHLERCVRILPHHQDTGGFFVSVLTKTAELPWMKQKPDDKSTNAEMEAASNGGDGDGKMSEEKTASNGNDDKDKKSEDNDGDTKNSEENAGGDAKIEAEEMMGRKKRTAATRSGSPPPYKKQRQQGYKEDPFIFLSRDDPFLPNIRKYYDLSEDFPAEQMLVRCETGKRRHIYFTSSNIHKLVEYNRDRIHFINLGLKILSRSESKYSYCDYRLVQEGIQMFYPYVNKRIVEATKHDLVALLSQENPFLNRLTPTTQKKMEAFGEQGSVIFKYNNKNDESGPCCDLLVCAWLGRTSCRSFLQKSDRAHILRLFGVELKTREEILAEKAKKTEDNGDGKEEVDSAEDITEKDENSEQMETKDTEVDSIEDNTSTAKEDNSEHVETKDKEVASIEDNTSRAKEDNSERMETKDTGVDSIEDNTEKVENNEHMKTKDTGVDSIEDITEKVETKDESSSAKTL